jgi:hypothetical protein
LSTSNLAFVDEGISLSAVAESGLCTNALGSYLPVICQWLCLTDHF